MEGAEELEVGGDLLNTTAMDAENASNLTGRAAATPEGMLVTYSALFMMALGPILIGSLRSVPYHSAMRVSVPDGRLLLLISGGHFKVRFATCKNLA